MIYVGNEDGEDIDVIDGVTNLITSVSTGSSPGALDVNPVTNKSYVANAKSNSVTVIDGATNSTTMLSAGTNPLAVAVNWITNTKYIGTTYGWLPSAQPSLPSEAPARNVPHSFSVIPAIPMVPPPTISGKLLDRSSGPGS
jgi:YVTN family beta-propeller protein